MKVKNVSQRKYIHGSFSINPGAVLTVPDYIGKLWIRTGEIIEVKEIEQVIKVTEPIKAEEPKEEIKEVKAQPKKVNKNAKRNNKRV